MTFLHPLGLLGLIGIPILIIIYIIKTQYTEQTVSSTFLWTLSEKFLKRKNPISKIAGIISLILQLLAVTVISLAIAHPVITLKGSAQEYCFILDGSASMNMTDGSSTRFERGRAEIGELIDGATDGSVYSLVLVGDTTETVFEQIGDKKQALKLLDSVLPSHTADDFTDALGIAQAYFDANPGIKAYLVTDKTYAYSENVTVIDVSLSEQNVSLGEISYSFSGGQLTVDGTLIAYGGDEVVELELYIDGAEAPVYSGSFLATAARNPFQLYASVPSFRSARIVMTMPDALSLDNEFVIYNHEGESVYNTLIVSDRPDLIRMAVTSILKSNVDVVSTKDYDGRNGYGLYIFDSCSPTELPRDGAVWFINPVGTVKDAGFSYQSEVTLPNGGKLSLSTDSSTIAKRLREEFRGSEVSVSAFVKCGLYKDFSTLYTYQGNPIVFAGTNNFGNRQVVLAFDLHKSNIAITFDYSAMMKNLINYSFPDIIEKPSYEVGENLEINVIANTESIRLDTPTGDVKYLDVSRAISEHELKEVGTYTVTVTVAGTQRVFNIYSEPAEAEREVTVYANTVALAGEAGAGGFDGELDTMNILFIALAVLFLADWGVYLYEKHQLR